MDREIHDILVDIILRVAMQHHDDISASDENSACDAADEILKEFPQIAIINEKDAADSIENDVLIKKFIDSRKKAMKSKKLTKYSRDSQFDDNRPMLYFVTTKRDKNSAEDHDRCIGYYMSLDIARSVVRDSAECLCEAGYYQYAIIEAFGSGWYPSAKKEEWYEFIDCGKKAKRMQKPKKYEHICNFGIG